VKTSEIIDSLTPGELEALGVAGNTKAYKGKRTDYRAATVSGLIARRLQTRGLARVTRISGAFTDRVLLTDTGRTVLRVHEARCGAVSR
jgi:hypothetical protein